ncbi:MAG: PilZ domain-containing protein [Phycisphaerales bacterium]|nr:PilZ domain-containing protein [Planctomycetota bacterium]
MNAINRRKFERFALPPMYTPICVRLADGTGPALEGHAYDVSEGGIRFELDSALPAGTAVAVQITLPAGNGPAKRELEASRTVCIFGNVIWVDQSEPGPVRMALAITRFARLGDRERLLGKITSGRFLRAA